MQSVPKSKMTIDRFTWGFTLINVNANDIACVRGHVSNGSTLSQIVPLVKKLKQMVKMVIPLVPLV